MNFTTYPLQKVVNDMMLRFGGPSILKTHQGGMYDPSIGENTPIIETPYDVKIIVLDYIPKVSGIGAQNGTNIQQGDKQIFMKSEIPLPKLIPLVDLLSYQGEDWKIVVVKELNPSGSLVFLYELYVRK